MRFRIAALAALLALSGAACAQNDDDNDLLAENDTSGEEFTLTGLVLDTQAGAEPEGGFPGEEGEEGDSEATDDAEATDDPDEDPDHGGIAIRPDTADGATTLSDCETTRSAFITYYVEDTDFEPESLRDHENFPQSLERQRVTVTGTMDMGDDEDVDVDADAEAQVDDDGADVDANADVDATEEPSDEAECVLVLDSLELAAESEGDDEPGGIGGATPGGTDDPDDDATAPAETEPGSTPGLPEGVEDTDPIFEGTPSPDECEGQKACREED